MITLPHPNFGVKFDFSRHDRDEYEAYLASPEWGRMKKWAKSHYGNKCALCGSSDEIHVHHTNYKRLGREYPEDLSLLCKWCHAKHHTPARDYSDPDGHKQRNWDKASDRLVIARDIIVGLLHQPLSMSPTKEIHLASFACGIEVGLQILGGPLDADFPDYAVDLLRIPIETGSDIFSHECEPWAAERLIRKVASNGRQNLQDQTIRSPAARSTPRP